MVAKHFPSCVICRDAQGIYWCVDTHKDICPKCIDEHEKELVRGNYKRRGLFDHDGGKVGKLPDDVSDK